MEKKASLDLLLMQISEMLEMLKKPKDSPMHVTPEILNDLTRVEKAIQTLTHYQEAAFQNAHVDPNRLIQETLDNPQTSSRDRQLLKRAKDIEKDARTFHLAFSKAIERGKGRKKTKKSSDDTTRQQLKERRKLFKPLGGDKTWIPL